MRIAIISAPSVKRKPPDYALSLAKGMESMGHRVDIVDAWTEDGMWLPGYEYIAIAAEPVSFFSSRLTSNISRILAAGSALSGRKSAAFIKKKGLFSNRALANLMRIMEKEGMVINWSDILLNCPHAQAMGKKIGS